MQENRDVNKYARALYDVSEKSKCIDKTVNHLQKISAFYYSSSEFRLFLQSKRIEARKKKEIINKVLSDEVSFLELEFLNHLIDNDDIILLKLIIKQFNSICNQEEKIVQAMLTTVKELDFKQKTEILNLIEKKINKKINLDYTFDSSLLGGAKLRIGNIIFDGSISKRLEKLEQLFYNR